jgi:hypothetical protein
LRISVRETTPVSLPDMRAPIMAEAGTADEGCGEDGTPGMEPADDGPGKLPGPAKGVGGVVDEGDADSTIHIL